MEELLLIPGPTMVPEEVNRAVARPMISHRSSECASLFREIREGLRPFFGGEGEILLFPSSGTGMMESALANLFSPGDRVLAVVMGAFGRRFAQLARSFGLEVEVYELPPGEAPSGEDILQRLGNGRFRGVLLTHNETATGTCLDLSAVSLPLAERGYLVAVDGVSSVGGMPVEAARAQSHVIVTASQKALMSPPGVGIAFVASEAWEEVEKARLPRYYWNYLQAREAAAKGQTPYTPAVGIWFGLREALRLLGREGREKVFLRHRLLGRAVRAGLQALGFRLLARREEVASPVVTAAYPPEGVEAPSLIRLLKERFGVVVAGGQDELQGRIIRVAHMGAVRWSHLARFFQALEAVLGELGRGERGGLEAAEGALQGLEKASLSALL